MTRLHILSDLHIEFGPFECPSLDADVTILAGDIFTKIGAARGKMPRRISADRW